MCTMIRGAANCLWLMKIWCVQWKRRFKRTDDSPFRNFPCSFHKFYGHFFTRKEPGYLNRYRGGLRAGWPWFDSRQCSRPHRFFPQPPIQWVPWALSPGVKREGREADHSPPSSAEVKKGGAISALPYVFMT
jgi:hypothetical protein